MDAILAEAKAVADDLPLSGLPLGELRAALGNWRKHRGAHSRIRRRADNCLKCFTTSERLLRAVGRWDLP